MNAEAAIFLPDALVIDVPKIDEQHAELFALGFRLKETCIELNYLPAGEADVLLDALRDHFATEQGLAGQIGLDFSGHALQHEKMLSCVASTLNKVRSSRIDAFSLFRYLEYWFERHICEADRPLGLRLQPTTRLINARPFRHQGAQSYF